MTTDANQKVKVNQLRAECACRGVEVGEPVSKNGMVSFMVSGINKARSGPGKLSIMIEVGLRVMRVGEIQKNGEVTWDAFWPYN